MVDKVPALPVKEETDDRLIDRFADLLDRISIQVRPERLEAWSEIELTMHQFRTLAALRRRPLRIGDLASILGIRLSSATSLIDRLAAKGLLQRIHDLNDRRAVLCQLTPLGMKEAESLWRINKEWITRVAQSLTAAELRTVVHAFQIFSSAVDRQDAQEAESTAPAVVH